MALKVKLPFSKSAPDLAGEIAALREQITLRLDDRARVETLPRPFEDATQQVDAWLDSLEEAANLSISGFTTGAANTWPIISRDNGHFKLAGLLAAGCRDGIRQAMLDRLSDWYEDRDAATAEERNRRLVEIDADIDRLCRREEALIREAEAQGQKILRREDAPPAVVLAYDADLN